MKIVFPILLLLSGSIIHSASGQSESSTIFTFNPKLGVYNFLDKEDGGFLVGAELNVSKKNLIYSIDYFRFKELIIYSPYPEEYYNQLGLMMGKYHSFKDLRFQYQGGVASLWGLRRTDIKTQGSGIYPWSYDYYNTEDFFTIGLAAKLGFKWVIAPRINIGIDFQANLNSIHPLGFGMISIVVGRMPNINK